MESGSNEIGSNISSEVRLAAEATLLKRIGQMKTILYGEAEGVAVDESKAIELSRCIQEEGLLLLLIDKLGSIPFEARKDTALVFNNLIRWASGIGLHNIQIQ